MFVIVAVVVVVVEEARVVEVFTATLWPTRRCGPHLTCAAMLMKMVAIGNQEDNGADDGDDFVDDGAE